MLRYIKKYPLSVSLIMVVIYLSFFRPPSPQEMPTFPGMDKVVHFMMYFGMSGTLWWEHMRVHRTHGVPRWHVWVGGLLCPIAFSGLIELLQSYCTTYRGGDWWDFAANTGGALVASVLAYIFIIRK